MAIDAPVHCNAVNFNRVLNAGLPVLVVLWRRDCPACEQLNPALDRLAKAYADKALVVKVNADEEATLAQRLGASSLPALFLFRDGKEVGRGAGAAPERDLAAWLDYLQGNGARPPAPSGPSTPLRPGAAGPTSTASKPASAASSGPAQASTSAGSRPQGQPAPAAGAGTVTVAFSLSISTRSSSFSTRSPSCFSHCEICTSKTDSPTAGTLTSTAIIALTEGKIRR